MRASTYLSRYLLAVGTLVPGLSSAQTWTDFQVGNTTRKALVYVPDGAQNAPLLISLHGRGIPASWNQGEMMKFEPIADREKFIVVYPEALNNLNWDLGGTSDTDFIEQIIDDMSADYGIDTNRVYASGFSMGGMFSYTLACKLPDKIAAIAPGNGYPLGGLSGCVESRSVPIFHMHGTADDFVAYSGIHNFLGSLIDNYGCPADPIMTDPYPVEDPQSQSFTETWGPCVNDRGPESEIVLVSVTGMIHDWATAGKANTNEDPAFAGKPFDIDGSEEAWAFLKNHSLLGADDVPIPGTGGDSGEGGSGGSDGSGGDSSASGGESSASGGADAGTGGANGSGGALTSTGGNSDILPPAGTGGAVSPPVPGDGDGDAEGSSDESAAGCSCKMGARPQGNSTAGFLGLLLALGWMARFSKRRNFSLPTRRG